MHKLYITNGHWGHFCHGSKETDLGHMGSNYQGFGLFNVNLKVNWPKKKIKKKKKIFSTTTLAKWQKISYFGNLAKFSE